MDKLHVQNNEIIVVPKWILIALSAVVVPVLASVVHSQIQLGKIAAQVEYVHSHIDQVTDNARRISGLQVSDAARDGEVSITIKTLVNMERRVLRLEDKVFSQLRHGGK